MLVVQLNRCTDLACDLQKRHALGTTLPRGVRDQANRYTLPSSCALSEMSVAITAEGSR